MTSLKQLVFAINHIDVVKKNIFIMNLSWWITPLTSECEKFKVKNNDLYISDSSNYTAYIYYVDVVRLSSLFGWIAIGKN